MEARQAEGMPACGHGKMNPLKHRLKLQEDFISRQNDMTVFDCYTDIGKTGTDFKREGFERMMRDVRMRRIDCIIVKDLSRLGETTSKRETISKRFFHSWGSAS